MIIYSKGDRAVALPDKKSAKIMREYKTRPKDVDKTFALEVVGDASNDTVGPFEMSFDRGGVTPMSSRDRKNFVS